MLEQNIVQLIEKLGFPIGVCIYLLYLLKNFNRNLTELQTIISDLTTQNAYMISALINYRSGNKDSGDRLANQAVYIGNESNKRVKEKKGTKKSDKEGATNE